MSLYFTSEFFSNDGEKFKVDLHADSYNGIDAEIIGGSGSVFYLNGDWTDYLQTSQDVLIDASTEVVVSFTYNSANDRTEVEVGFLTYTSQAVLKNNTALSNSYVPSFSPDIISLFINWNAEGDILLQSVKSSFADISYSNNAAYFDRFLDNYLQSNDADMKVAIYRDDSGWLLDWAGNLVVDLIEWDDVSKPRPYNFRAIDGIDRLKDLEYEDALTSPTTTTFIELVQSILDKNGLSGFWGGADAYIRESIEYVSDDVISASSSHSPLAYSFLHENMLLKKRMGDKDEAITYYDILTGLMQLFSCRLFISEGIYHITQVRNYNSSSYNYREFFKSGTSYTIGSFTHNLTLTKAQGGGDLQTLASRKYGYLAGLNKVKMDIPDANEVNLNGRQYINVYNGTTYTPSSVSWTVGDIAGGVGSGAVIRCEFDVEEYATSFAVGTFNLQIKFEVYVNNRFIKGGGAIEPYWGNDSVTTDRFWEKRVVSQGAGTKKHIVYLTPEIPFDETGVTMKLTFDYRGNQITGAGEQAFRVSPVKLFFQGAVDKDLMLEVDNVNSNYTKTLELDSLIIADMNSFSSLNKIQVDENHVSGTQSLVSADLWDGGFDASDKLSYLRVMEAMSLQFRPLERLIGAMDGYYRPNYTIRRDGKTYIFNGFKLNYSLDEVDGEFIEVATAKSGLTISEHTKGEEAPKDGGDTGGDLQQMAVQFNRITTVDSDVSVGTVTSFDIAAIGSDRLFTGDKIKVVHPTTFDTVETFEVSADVSDTATSISVTSKTTTNELKAGYYLVFDVAENVQATTGRFDTLFVGGTEITSGGGTGKLTTKTISASAYTFVIGDAGLMIIQTRNSSSTLTVPPESSVAWADGTRIYVLQDGNGTVTFAEGTGVTINSLGSALNTSGRYARAELVKVAPDEWNLSGDITT